MILCVWRFSGRILISSIPPGCKSVLDWLNSSSGVSIARMKADFQGEARIELCEKNNHLCAMSPSVMRK
jgi:hypothetical protein